MEPLGLHLPSLPGVAAHPAVVGFVQGGLLLGGACASLALLAARSGRGGGRRQAAKRTWSHSAIMGTTALTLWLTIFH